MDMYKEGKVKFPGTGRNEQDHTAGSSDRDADGNTVLCAASAYEQKYYLNPKFRKLPEDIKKELKIISVLFTEEIGGSFMLEFDPEGELQFRTEALGSDYDYDEIGAALMCREIRMHRQELLRSLELYYQVLSGKLAVEEIEKKNEDRDR